MSVPPRPAWSLAAVALAGLLRAAPSAAGPIDVVRDCAARSSAQASGIEELNGACPGLEDALQALGLDPLLYDGWRQHLNRDALGDVAKLAEDYRRAAPAGPPDVAALAGVLKTLADEQAPAPDSWWDMVKAWLGDWLRGHDTGAFSWLDRWLGKIGQSLTVVNVALYSLAGLVLTAAAWIVVNELRAAGVIGRSGRRIAADAAGDSAAADSVRTGADAGPRAPAERIGVLLRLLVARLMQTGRLKGERSLTHRELVLRAEFDSESQRAVFDAVASTAEAVLYGAQPAAPEHLHSVLRQGQNLLAQLPDSTSTR